MAQHGKDIEGFEDKLKDRDDEIDELNRKLNDHRYVRRERLDEAEDLYKKLIAYYVPENVKLRKTIRDCDAEIKVKNNHGRQEMTKRKPTKMKQTKISSHKFTYTTTQIVKQSTQLSLDQMINKVNDGDKEETVKPKYMCPICREILRNQKRDQGEDVLLM